MEIFRGVAEENVTIIVQDFPMHNKINALRVPTVAMVTVRGSDKFSCIVTGGTRWKRARPLPSLTPKNVYEKHPWALAKDRALFKSIIINSLI